MASQREKRSLGAGLLRPGRRVDGRFGLLLLLLIASFIIIGFSEEGWAPWLSAGLGILLLLVAFRGTRLLQNLPLIAAMGGVGLLTLLVGSAVLDGDAQQGAVAVGSFLLFLAIAIGVLDRVMRQEDVTVQTIFGALSVYFLLGLLFASIFGLLDAVGAEPLFGESVNDSVYSYFSFVTMTTVGYGDYTAKTELGRRIAIILAMTGQTYLAVLLGRLVSMYRSPREAAAEAAESTLDDASGS